MTNVNAQNYSLEHPVYTVGSVSSNEDAIHKIKEQFAKYSEKKYVNFVGTVTNLNVIQVAFPNHIVSEKWVGYYTIRPK
jgi:hypothetical protein